jgi:hypothetical protein
MISEENPAFGYLTREVGQILMKVMEPVLKKHHLLIEHWQVLNSIPVSEKTKVEEIHQLFSDKGWIDPSNLYERETNKLKLTNTGSAAQQTIFNEIHARRKLLFKDVTNENFQIATQVMKQIIANEKEID